MQAKAEYSADLSRVPAPGENADYSIAYKRFVLVMLTIVYAFNFIDRQILVILQEPIKNDMNLSDAQLGLLSGLGLGPFLTGLMSDLLQPISGDNNLRHAMLLTATLGASGILTFFLASRRLIQDLDAAEATRLLPGFSQALARI